MAAYDLLITLAQALEVQKARYFLLLASVLVLSLERRKDVASSKII